MKSKKVEHLPPVENSEVPNQKIETKITRKKGLTCGSRFLKSLPRFGLLFGLDVSLKPNVIVSGICFIVILMYFVMCVLLVQRNSSCFNDPLASLLKNQCSDGYYNTNNLLDAALGFCSAFSLFLNRGSIAKLLHELLKIFDSDLEFQVLRSSSSAKLAVCILSAFGILFCLNTPIGLVVQYHSSDIFNLLFSQNRVWDTFLIICNTPLLMSSMYFCLLYAMVCFVLRYNFHLLAKNAPNLSYSDFRKQEKRFEALLNLTESCFSQTLPVIYFLRVATVVVYAFYLVFDQEMHFDSLGVIWRTFNFGFQVLQLLLLIVPPILVNAVVSSPVEGPENDSFKIPQRTFGVYFPNSFEMQMSTELQLNRRPCYLTVGGFRISLWPVIMILVLAAGMVAFAHNRESLLKMFEKPCYESKPNTNKLESNSPSFSNSTNTTDSVVDDLLSLEELSKIKFIKTW